MKAEINQEYKTLVDKHSPPSPTLKNCSLAFLTGGFLCFVGQWLAFLFLYLGIEEERAYALVSVVFIVIAAAATALGFFDRIARHAGAGTLVPVTGFSNSVSSAAIDNRSEGLVLGVGAKIFTVAGPVILYATLTGTLFGVIYYLVSLFGGVA